MKYFSLTLSNFSVATLSKNKARNNCLQILVLFSMKFLH